MLMLRLNVNAALKILVLINLIFLRRLLSSEVKIVTTLSDSNLQNWNKLVLLMMATRQVKFYLKIKILCLKLLIENYKIVTVHYQQFFKRYKISVKFVIFDTHSLSPSPTL